MTGVQTCALPIWDTAGDPAHLDAGGLDQLADIHSCGLTLQTGICGPSSLPSTRRLKLLRARQALPFADA